MLQPQLLWCWLFCRLVVVVVVVRMLAAAICPSASSLLLLLRFLLLSKSLQMSCESLAAGTDRVRVCGIPVPKEVAFADSFVYENAGVEMIFLLTY